MKLTPVKSSSVESIGYHEPSKTLRVKFLKGPFPYEYYNVSTKEYESLMNSSSIGSTLKEVVQGKRFTKVS